MKKTQKDLKQKISYWLGVVIVGLVFGFSLQFVRAWVEPLPGTVPPEGNIDAPINVGPVTQTKAGNLGIGGGLLINGVDPDVISNPFKRLYSLIIRQGQVGIGTENPDGMFQVNSPERGWNSVFSHKNNVLGIWLEDTSGSGARIGTSSNGPLYLMANNRASQSANIKLNPDGTVEIPTLKTKQASCKPTYLGHDNAYGCTAKCPDGWMVTGGGFDWGTVFTHMGQFSYINERENGWSCAVNIDSCSQGDMPCKGNICVAVCMTMSKLK
jgi:hypothetical protein